MKPLLNARLQAVVLALFVTIIAAPLAAAGQQVENVARIGTPFRSSVSTDDVRAELGGQVQHGLRETDLEAIERRLAPARRIAGQSVDAIKAWLTEPPFSAQPPSRPSSPVLPPRYSSSKCEVAGRSSSTTPTIRIVSCSALSDRDRRLAHACLSGGNVRDQIHPLQGRSEPGPWTLITPDRRTEPVSRPCRFRLRNALLAPGRGKPGSGA